MPLHRQGARDACFGFENRLDVMGFYGDEAAAAASTNPKNEASRGKLCRFVETVDGR